MGGRASRCGQVRRRTVAPVVLPSPYPTSSTRPSLFYHLAYSLVGHRQELR